MSAEICLRKYVCIIQYCKIFENRSVTIFEILAGKFWKIFEEIFCQTYFRIHTFTDIFLSDIYWQTYFSRLLKDFCWKIWTDRFPQTYFSWKYFWWQILADKFSQTGDHRQILSDRFLQKDMLYNLVTWNIHLQELIKIWNMIIHRKILFPIPNNPEN